MELLEAALFGIIQGLTEFLPVSSSGHLALFGKFSSFPPEGGLLLHIVSVHIASLLAVLIVFRRDILSLFTSHRKVILMLVIGTIPAGAFGLLSRNFFEQAGSSMVLVGMGFLVSALFLLLGDRKKEPRKELKKLSVIDSITIGFAQALAILPGVSRSGSTISSARYRGVQGFAAAKFSFLLVIPAVGGAALLDAAELLESGVCFDPTPMAVSFVTAFVVAVIALKVLLRLLKKGKFSYFSYYLIPLGIATISYGLFSSKIFTGLL